MHVSFNISVDTLPLVRVASVAHRINSQQLVFQVSLQFPSATIECINFKGFVFPFIVVLLLSTQEYTMVSILHIYNDWYDREA